jgi:MFS transporter, DHA2 family, multidrug resistance protein
MSAAVTTLPAAAPVEASWRKWAILVAASLGALLEVIDTSIVNVALTDIQASLGATLSEVGWVVTIYAIANVIILPLTAWLGDRFGKKRYFIFSLVAFTAASMLCGFATNLPILIFARLLQGLGGGGLLAKAQAILFETFPPAQQAMAQAVFGVCVIAGPAIGPTLGGYLTTALDWRWIFFVNLPFGIVATFMCITFLRDEAPKDTGKPVDWLGIFLLIVAVGGLQTMLEEGNQEDWFESGFIIACALAAGLGAAAFVWREMTTKYPVVDLRVLRHRSLAAGSILSMILGMGLYGATFAVPIFTQSILHFTAQQTGLVLLPGAIASAFMFPLMGKLSGKIDARFMIAAGGTILAGVIFWMSSIMTPQTSADDFFWPMIIRGLATVMMYLPLTLATLSPVPRSEISAASGIYSLTRQTGGSVGIAVLTMLLTNRQAFHRAVLVEKLSVTSPAVQERVQQLAAGFAAKGKDAISALGQAYKLLDGMVSQQAAVLSFGDIFFAVGIAFVCALPLVLLLGSGKGAKVAPDAH